MKKLAILPLIAILIISCVSQNELNEAPITHDPIPKDSLDRKPCNPQASDETRAVLEYIASLSEDPFQGAIVGQNCGHTVEIYHPNHMMSHATLVESLYEETGKWVGILSVEYEHDRLYTMEELSKANAYLIDHWNAGGLVSVGFAPSNPWSVDERDLENKPGFWTNSRTSHLNQGQLDQIDLGKLIDPQEEIHSLWMMKLDRIADALEELKNAGVVVIFKPLQEMNGDWFWWGIHSHPNDPEPYVALYRHLFEYFTYQRNLDNILWIYAPANSQAAGRESWLKPIMWTYPGDDYVDILTCTTYSKDLIIYNYQQLLESGKPLAMAEYGPDHEDNHGLFDNRTYIRQISQRYTGIAFWISWEDWQNGDGSNTYMSIINNQYANDLMNHPSVLTREDIDWRDYLP